MENKIIDFVREFNTHLEETNQYCNLNYQNDGNTQCVTFPRLMIFNDDIDVAEFVKQKSLSCLLKTISEVSIAVGVMLGEEVNKFFVEKEKQVKEKFPSAKIKTSQIAICRWKMVLSGQYNEDIMDDFMDVLREDFLYIFDGLEIDLEW